MPPIVSLSPLIFPRRCSAFAPRGKRVIYALLPRQAIFPLKVKVLTSPFTFSRIIKKDGTILTVVAGENHLFELKEILYDTPYRNDEAPPETKSLVLKEKRKATKKILLESKEDIDALFRMTPYYYHTSDKDKAKLEKIESLEVTTEFVVYVYGKGQGPRAE